MKPMPEILTYNSPSEIEKRRLKQSSSRYFSKSIYNWFRKQDKFTKTYIIAFLMMAIATPFIVSQYLNFAQRAEGPSIGERKTLEVIFVNPTDGEAININSKVLIIAAVSDPKKASKVEFYIDGDVKCSVNSAPYVCNWQVSGTPQVTHTLTAKVYSFQNNYSTSTIKVKSE